MNRTLALIATVGAFGVLSLGITTPAFAEVSTSSTSGPTAHSSLSAIQAAGATGTANRITALNAGVTKVDATTTLTADDRATILGRLNADLGGMASLQSKIAADTDAATAYADYRSMYTDWRVYAVSLQQSLIAATADGLTGTAIPKLQSAATKIAAAFAADPSKATPALRSQLADMQAKTADAVTKTNGLAATALAVTPAAYDANHSILVDPRAASRDALAGTKAAAADGQAIVAALK
jgi:hypothetical protein